MRAIILCIGLFLLMAVADGTKKGKEGNRAYRAEQYEDATEAFRSGLQDPDNDETTDTGLNNNLGSALYQQGDFENAAFAFQNAIQTATTKKEISRANYNAGNNAFRMQNNEAALDFYKNALINDPHNQDARFNYEFVKRQMQEQEDQENQDQENEDQENQDQENQDQQNQDQDQENEDQENQDQENQDQENQDQQNQDQEQNDSSDQEQQQNQQEQEQQQQQEQNMSKEQAEQLLEAVQMDESELLKDARRMRGRPRQTQKDW